MGLKNLVSRYNKYESPELARREAKKKKLVAYRALKNVRKPVTKPGRKLTKKRFTNTIGK
jgi:hypothetical protein